MIKQLIEAELHLRKAQRIVWAIFAELLSGTLKPDDKDLKSEASRA